MAVLLFQAGQAVANDDYPSVQFRGFGTAAMGGTDTDKLGYRLSNTQRKGLTSRWGFDNDSRLGLQLDVDFNRDWHVGVQWVARNHVGDFFEQNLDWAYLRWRPHDDIDIRVGRLGLDGYFMSEYRNVGYAYPWLSPPHEFYGSNAVYHYDGGDIVWRLPAAGGVLTPKLFAGRAYYELPIYESDVLQGAADLFGGNLSFERGDWRFRISHMYAREAAELPLGELLGALGNAEVNAAWPGANTLIPKLKVMGKSLRFSSVGLSYDDGTWLIQSEAAYTDSDVEVQPNTVTGYLSVGRRFGPVTLYSVYGIGETLHHQIKLPPLRVNLPELQAMRHGVNDAFNANGMDEQSATLGLRWDVYKNVALKAQWSHYWLGQNGMVQWDLPGAGPRPDQVNVWLMGLDFVF